MKWLKKIWAGIASVFKQSNQTPSSPTKPQPSKGWDSYWGELIKRLVIANIETFDEASDIHDIRPDWTNLSDEQKAEVMEAFFKSLVYFESAYNPLSESVDVGNKYDKQTWSVGLLQLSGVDKKNLGLPVGYDYEGLKNPENNIQQGIAIMVNQIKKRGKILIPKSEKGNPGVYWATLNPGNKYDKSYKIIEATQAVKFTEQKQPTNNETPWMDIALAEVGVSESRNPKRVIEYHQTTTLKAKDVKTAWCSSFACWVLQQVGYKTTRSAWARDWLKYGQIADLQRGAILVFERNGPGGDSHVGFYTGKENSIGYEIISGNSGDAVTVQYYPKSKLLGCRWPIK